jgi:hypothetical protein
MTGRHARSKVIGAQSISRRTAANCAGQTAVKARAQAETQKSTPFLDYARSAIIADS